MRQSIGLSGELVPGSTYLGGPAWSVSVNLPDEDSLKIVIADFRLLYTDTNASSAMRALSILRRSARARETPQGEEVIEALKAVRQYIQQRRNEDPVGKILDAEPDGTLVERRPQDIIALWFNGEYFHDDHELAEQLEPVDGLDVDMLRMALHTVIRDHVKAWIVIRNTVRGVLAAHHA